MNKPLKKRLAFMKSLKVAIPGLLITYLLYAYVTARPPDYCAREKRIIPKDEMCIKLYDKTIERGDLLLGPTEKTGRDYHANHPDNCQVRPEETNGFRLGGIFEVFFDDRLEAFIRYEMTDKAKHSNGNTRRWEEWDIITSCGEIKRRSGDNAN
ncbi:hypothetical protein ACO0LM_28565 [Undibacterium sp. Di26W]|uniref:hypothetical protein n=1 Tax=Undibacterium sp. Di26W TaxID=3413035 RepID=UPI003BF3C813